MPTPQALHTSQLRLQERELGRQERWHGVCRRGKLPAAQEVDEVGVGGRPGPYSASNWLCDQVGHVPSLGLSLPICKRRGWTQSGVPTGRTQATA